MFHIASIVDVSMFPNIEKMNHVNVTGKSTWATAMGFRYLSHMCKKTPLKRPYRRFQMG